MCQHKEKPLERKLWQQGCRFSFQKNKQFVQAYSSVVSECIAASSPVRLNLRLKEVESKPKMQAKKTDICKGKMHNSWAYYPRWEWVVLHPCKHHMCILQSQPKLPFQCNLLVSQHCCPPAGCIRGLEGAGGVWRAWGPSCSMHPLMPCSALSDSKTAELAKCRPVAAGEVHQWDPGHVAFSGLHPRNGRWAQGAPQPLLSQPRARCWVGHRYRAGDTGKHQWDRRHCDPRHGFGRQASSRAPAWALHTREMHNLLYIVPQFIQVIFTSFILFINKQKSPTTQAALLMSGAFMDSL